MGVRIYVQVRRDDPSMRDVADQAYACDGMIALELGRQAFRQDSLNHFRVDRKFTSSRRLITPRMAGVSIIRSMGAP